MISFSDPFTYWHIALALAVLILPGAALYLAARRLSRRESEWDPGFALMAGIGLSVALWPLLLLYASLVRIPFLPLVSWVVLLASGAYLAFEVWSRFQQTAVRVPPSAFRTAVGVAAVLLTLISLALRVEDVRGLAVPLFGDSLHHTMITSLILERGAVPDGYLPYVPTQTFTYHFGFHTLAAIFANISGTSSHYAVLLLGQVMIALTVPLAYLLNVTLFRSPMAGLFAAFLTGFVSLMPAFYTNWGRYTQLAGQLLLMVALVFLVRLMRQEWRREDFALLAVCVAGLMVVHYRILIFFGLFALPLAVLVLVRNRGRWQAAVSSWARGAGATLAGLLLALPWIVNLIVNYLPGLGERLGTVTEDYLAEYNNLEALLVYGGRLMAGVALLGVIVAVVMALRPATSREDGEAKRWYAAGAALVVATWVGLLVLSLYVRPGAIGSYTVAIMLYIPLSALGGYGLGTVIDLAASRWAVVRQVAVAGVVVVAPLAAIALGTAQLVDAGSYNYVQRSDLQAFEWIRSNVSPQATFLISSEFSYTGRAVTASDAGMWLPLLTGRNVSVPALNSWMEKPVNKDFFSNTKELAAYTQPLTITAGLGNPDSNQSVLVERGIISEPRLIADEEALSLMRELGVTHVYAGSQEGKSEMRLDLEAIKRDTEHFEMIYDEGGVSLFRLR